MRQWQLIFDLYSYTDSAQAQKLRGCVSLHTTRRNQYDVRRESYQSCLTLIHSLLSHRRRAHLDAAPVLSFLVPGDLVADGSQGRQALNQIIAFNIPILVLSIPARTFFTSRVVWKATCGPQMTGNDMLSFHALHCVSRAC